MRLDCLDGLRGVLAVYVMLGHMAPFAALPGWIISPLGHGGAAVDIFFMLSGLVIFRSLESCGFQARPFLVLRATRIFPVFLVMFVTAVVLQPLPEPFPWMPWIAPDAIAHDILPQGWPTQWPVEIAAHLTMTHGLFPNAVLPDAWNSFLAAAWSLSTEWQFYLLALFLGRTRMRANRMAGAFIVLAAAGLAWDVAAPEAWRFSRAFLPNEAQYFALGIASADWVDRRTKRSFVLVLGTTLILSAAHGNAGKLAPPLLWTLCLAAQLSTDKPAWIAVPLRWRSMQWLGAISYPIYLANEPVQKALAFVLVRCVAGNPWVFDALWLPGAVLLPLGVAAWLHRYVEAPAHQWGRGVARGGGIVAWRATAGQLLPQRAEGDGRTRPGHDAS